MYAGRHAPWRRPTIRRARHAGVPRPGSPGYDARRDESIGSLLGLPILAGLLALAVVSLIVYRMAT